VKHAIEIPLLTTERLTLRGFEERHFPEYFAMVSDPEVQRFFGDGSTMGEIEAWRHMAQLIGHWVLRGFGLWAVEERATGKLVGRVGIHEPSGWPGIEVAYTIARPSWGRGYAREAARAALDFAQRTLGRHEVISIIRPDNVASVKVATALGAARSHAIQLLGAGYDVYRYPTPNGPAKP
jgi:RimJ/RimL family protein N-acetyltransferase